MITCLENGLTLSCTGLLSAAGELKRYAARIHFPP